MYESLLNFPGSVFGEFERMRRELDEVFGMSGMPTSIRAVAPGSFPAINVGTTPNSVEIYAFAPGLDASKIDLTVDRGVLTISGERPAPSAGGDNASAHSRERVFGSFKRTLSLPDDVDPARVNATYRDGLLQISIARQESSQPRRISVQ
jgi:HSP20 family protein